MDPYGFETEKMDDAYPRDYYSTGGRYRPPKRPRNYGWVVAVLGVVLLCVSGAAAVYRGQGTEATDVPVSAAVPAEASEAPQPEQVAADTAVVLGNGAELVIAADTGEQLTLQEIYKKTIPSVVSITASGNGGTATGTGIVMTADGYIITNYHVVSDASQVQVLTNDGDEFYASMVGGDETSDLVVLKIDANGLTPAEFGDSTGAEVGDSVVAIGDPLGTELRGTMTDGIICGIQRDINVGERTMNLMQTNAALNSGNSGGPLVNMHGQVIGINTMKLTSSYTSVEGIGFAIPISTAKPIVDELMCQGYVSGRPAFGFSVQVLDTRIAAYFNVPGRLCIQSVNSDSDAYRQGVREGDIITAIQGVAVNSTEEFNRVKNEYAAGDELVLSLYRSGTSFDVTVKLMDRAELN